MKTKFLSLSFFCAAIFASVILSGCNSSGGDNPTTGTTTIPANIATIKGVVKSALSPTSSKQKSSMEKALLATEPTSPIADADILCYDLESSSRTAAGRGKSDSEGKFSVSVDVGSDGEGNFSCFASWLDPVSKRVKVASIIGISAKVGQIIDIGADKGDMTVVDDILPPEVLGIYGDNTADRSSADGDPDPEFNPTGVRVGSKIQILFSDAVNPVALINGGIVINKATISASTKKCQKGVIHSESSGSDVDFDGTFKAFRYLPTPPLSLQLPTSIGFLASSFPYDIHGAFDSALLRSKSILLLTEVPP